MHRTPHWIVLAALALAALAAFAFALTAGSVDIELSAVARALFSPADDAGAGYAVVRELRLPRAMAAFAVGALLALAGTMMQVLLRNPLADPYVLGLSGGAACGALAALLAGASAACDACRFRGRAGLDAHRVRPGARRRRMGADATAADRRRRRDRMGRADHADPRPSAPEAQVRGMLFWLIGDLSGATRGGPALLALAGVLIVAMFFARDATLLARGDVDRGKPRRSGARHTLALHALAAFATAVAVTQSPAASASSGSSCRTRCASSSATTSAG